jgi:2-polyprenyl-3-methyl-5-hydroxy-6-metoxy-1,4-benzoquinol methylase
MSVSDRQRWNEKYAAKPVPDKIAPDNWLAEQTSSLHPGRALEVACGLGDNAIWLSQQGWTVDAVDISSLGLASAETLAQNIAARVNWIAADIDDFVPQLHAYDLMFVFRFLDRVRLPGIAQQALRPGGRLIYETFTAAHIKRPDSHMKNSAFALEPQELPRLFHQLDVVSYVECALADRDVARLVAVKPNYRAPPI